MTHCRVSRHVADLQSFTICEMVDKMVDKLSKKLGKQQAIYELIKNKGSIEPLNKPLNLKSQIVTSRRGRKMRPHKYRPIHDSCPAVWKTRNIQLQLT